MEFNSAFKGLKQAVENRKVIIYIWNKDKLTEEW